MINDKHPAWADLIQLFKEGKTAEIKSLLESEPLDPSDSNTATPLHLAVTYNNPEIVKFLTERAPVLINCYNKENKTALHLSAIYDTIEIAKLLLLADPKSAYAVKTGTETALHLAIRYDHPQVANLLIKVAPELIEFTNQNKNTPLHYAVISNNGELVKYLIKVAPQFIYAKDNDRETPFDKAAGGGQLEAFSPFVDFNPELLYVKNSYNFSMPIALAGSCGSPELIKFLFEHLLSPYTIKEVTEIVYSYLAFESKDIFRNADGTSCIEYPETLDNALVDAPLIVHLAGSDTNTDSQ